MVLRPIDLFMSGRFGRKNDKGKESEKLMASGVMESSTIQQDTQERVYFSKIHLVWFGRLI